jgi:Dolichyl-phosphate-mannose-protein mannosyltransferase
LLIVVALRLPFLNQPVEGDDPYYLYGAEHAQIDPLHPLHTKYLFQGDLVDMRGHPHGPLNSWILAAPLAVLGDVREIPFHLFYMLWSIVAALAMWSLARRFCERPLWAVLLFVSVPAFVVNGNSFEADLPFLACWIVAVAWFVKAVDENSQAALAVCAIAGAFAGIAAYQSILLTPILAAYLWRKRRAWMLAWCAILAAPVAIGAWQLYEYFSSGTLPAAMLAGYMRSYHLQASPNKLHSAAALVVHCGWIVSPLIVLFLRGPRWRWIAAGAAAIAGAFYDVNPLFWLSLACGVLLLASSIDRGFLSAWILIFFAGAAVVFFAGSARYLLPIAAPVAILAARDCRREILAVGFALQMALSIGLAVVNYQHWEGYRQFARSLEKDVSTRRVWINAEWGLRYYLETEGALPMPNGQVLQPGEIVVSSELALPLHTSSLLLPIADVEIKPAIPLRIISLGGRSAYSHSAEGLLPFEISRGPIDRVHAGVVVERKPQLTVIDPADPNAASQIVRGIYAPDHWMAQQATVVLKRPEHASPLRVAIFIPPQAPARDLQVLVDDALAANEEFPAPGAYTVTVPVAAGSSDITVTLLVDQTFFAPGDQRKLGVVVTKIGFW